MANKLILIRHPDKAGDNEGVYLGNTALITEQGERQIPLVIGRLRLLVPEAVTCSIFPRAVLLAERIAGELKLPVPIRSEFFNEIDKPQFLVGMRRDDPVHVEVMQAIRDQFDEDRVPTELLRGESIKSRTELEEEIRRTFVFVENFSYGSPISPHTLLAVTHAKRIAAILHWLYHKGSLKGYYQTTDEVLKISTTGITILTREPNRRTNELQWHIRTVNEEAHMEVGLEQEFQQLLDSINTQDPA